jgi:DNA-binding NarL/FixJ family response regulator
VSLTIVEFEPILNARAVPRRRSGVICLAAGRRASRPPVRPRSAPNFRHVATSSIDVVAASPPSGDARTAEYEPVALLLVDDDEIVRAWVRLALKGSEMSIVAEAHSSEAARDLVTRRRCDLLLVDHHLPGELGVDLVKHLRREGLVTPAVLMTASPERGLTERAREAGFQACVVKQSDSDALIDILRRVHRGETFFDVAHPRRPPGEAQLSRREAEALALVARGLTNREVAEQLGVAVETVKTLLERSYRKLGVKRRAEAVAEAQKRGLV